MSQTSDGEIQIMQITTGKTQKLKFKSPLQSYESTSNIQGNVRMVQINSQHIVVSSDQGSSMRVLTIEFENLKEAIEFEEL